MPRLPSALGLGGPATGGGVGTSKSGGYVHGHGGFGFGDLGRMDRHLNGLIWRGRLWVRPAVKGTVKGSDRTLTLYGGVAILKLCRGLCNGTGGVDRYSDQRARG
eukprot:scaffold1533_cov111-Isochrysis_galbana.AAC.1